MLADADIAKVLLDADDRLEDGGDLLFHWGQVKWYAGSDKEVDALMVFLDNVEDGDDYLFIRIGEDDNDTDIQGGWWDNPFEMGYVRRIEFLNPAAPPARVADLKSLNTRVDATRCAQCGGALADPGMGPAYKHCPKCEP